MEEAKPYGLRMAPYEEVLELSKLSATRVAGTNKDTPYSGPMKIIFCR